jgi:beta-galactosidase
VNAGGTYSYTDEAKVYWEADRPYERGSWGYIGGESARTHHRIFATGEDALFQSSREGMERYQFDVPDGQYRVTLGFAEGTRNTSAGTRVFDVSVNGQKLLEDVDLVGNF